MLLSVFDSIEYAHSTFEMQQKVMRHPNANTTAAEAARAAGLPPVHVVKIRCNDGQYYDVEVTVPYLTPLALSKYKRVTQKLADGKSRCITLAVGASLKAKKARWFTDRDFLTSEDVIKLSRRIRNVFEANRAAHHNQMLQQLREALHPNARRGLERLTTLVDGDGAGVLNYFKLEGFKLPPSFGLADCETFVNIARANKQLPRRWVVSSRPDGFGHQTGMSRVIDWENKEIRSEGWSSDD